MISDNYLKRLWDSVPEEGDLETGNRIWSAIDVAIWRKGRRKHAIYAVASMFSVAAALMSGVFAGIRLSDRGIQAVPQKEIVAMAENGSYYLPDGSTVWMERGGSLHFPETFTGEREVWLDGNASFEVVHEGDSSPFYVHADGADIKVIGTGFTVRQDAGEKISVTLHHGCVEFIAPGSSPIRLAPKQEVTYDTVSGEYSLSNFFSSISWQAGCYKIEDSDLNELVRFIEWQYGVQISVDDISDGHQRFNGTISLDEPLGVVLDKICYVLKIHCVQCENSYRLCR
ncbi:MAG: FecR domain-containing protein [Bacteroidales bacterium]|nr:FecR domain-containing protein [Bacteroidales bacterium]